MTMGYPLINANTASMRFIIVETKDYVHDLNQYLNNQFVKRSIEGIPDISRKNTSTNHNESSGYIDITNLKVGDEIVTYHSRYGYIPFIAIGKDHDAPDTVTILSKEILELLPFDAREINNSYSNKQKYGNNRYRYSNLLQWMNSEAEAGQWYTSKHSADQSPTSDNVWDNYNPYVDKEGFLHGFSEEFKRQLVTVNKITAKNTVTDGGGSEIVSSKIFLLSTTEVGLANENNIAEGTIYEYFSNNNTNAQRVAYPSIYCLNNAGGFTDTDFVEGKGWYYLLRTHYSSHSSSERGVHLDGSLNHYGAYLGHVGLRVGLVIRNYE